MKLTIHYAGKTYESRTLTDDDKSKLDTLLSNLEDLNTLKVPLSDKKVLLMGKEAVRRAIFIIDIEG